jgi:hypothetical protein
MQPEKVEINAEEQKVQAQNDQTKPTEVKAEQPETEQDRNWKKFREAREAEKKRNEELNRKAQEKEAEAAALKAALEAIVNKPQAPIDDYQDESEEQRIQKKVDEAIARREAEADRRRAEMEVQELPKKIREVHKDFDQVITDNNLYYLEYHHPELARALGNQPEGFTKWNDIYNAIKRYIPNTAPAAETKTAERNLAKPQAFTSSTPQPLHGGSNPIRLDEARKAANWARMKASLGKLD